MRSSAPTPTVIANLLKSSPSVTIQGAARNGALRQVAGFSAN
jgi:hypothetical protein